MYYYSEPINIDHKMFNDNKGVIPCAFTTNLDGMKNSEEANENVRKYEDMRDNSPVIIVETDLNGKHKITRC